MRRRLDSDHSLKARSELHLSLVQGFGIVCDGRALDPLHGAIDIDGPLPSLAVAAPQRVATLPNVATFAEEGLPMPELDAGAWFGILAPAGTPREIVQKLSQHFNDALKHPPVQEQLKSLGLVAVGTTPEAFAKFLHEEIERWPPIFARAGIGRNAEAQ
jgi:hypothetical protein